MDRVLTLINAARGDWGHIEEPQERSAMRKILLIIAIVLAATLAAAFLFQPNTARLIGSLFPGA
jgi:predicted small secreted protein